MTKLERIIITWPPIAFIIRKSKVIVLPGFQGIPLYDVVLFFFKQINTIGINERAAAIAFNLIMALPATMLFLFSILPYFPDFLKLREEFLSLFKDISPSSNTYHFIENLLDDLMQRNVGVFSFGFVLIMFYASNAMMALIRTFDKSIQENKNFFLHQRWRALQMTGILVLLIISTTLILIGQEQLVSLLRKFFHLKKRTVAPWVNFLRWSVVVALFYYGIALIYRYAPSVKKRWKLTSPGTLLATTLTIVTTEIFSYWVSNFASYNRVYGSIGTVLILMILIYINALILLIGFELNVSITYLVRKAEARNKG
ncbi:MAG: YihY/virulence factor BrkB family protein [Chitinophagaceae bacterium]|nr:YihY/virulence factor BrkB family protein [Chitinophagaceae bacterium]